MLAGRARRPSKTHLRRICEPDSYHPHRALPVSSGTLGAKDALPRQSYVLLLLERRVLRGGNSAAATAGGWRFDPSLTVRPGRTADQARKSCWSVPEERALTGRLMESACAAMAASSRSRLGRGSESKFL